MRLGNFCFSSLLCAVVIFTSPALAQRKTPPDPAKPKIRAITAFINLDRAQYQQQIADAMKMLKYARTVFESRDFEVETIRISTQPFSEYTKGLTAEQALAFFKNYDALAQKEKFAASIGPAMLNADDPESQADLLVEVLKNTKSINSSLVVADENGVRWPSVDRPRVERVDDPKIRIVDRRVVDLAEAAVALHGGPDPAGRRVRGDQAGLVRGQVLLIDAGGARRGRGDAGRSESGRGDAGRTRSDEAIDPAVGFYFERTVGERVSAQDAIVWVHSDDPARAREAVQRLERAITVQAGMPERAPLLIERVG